MKYVDPVHLRQVLTQYYNEGELRTMCFDLGIDYESLGGRSKPEKAAELILYAQRGGRLDEIADYVGRTRPHVQLKMTDTPPSLPEAAEGGGNQGGTTINIQGGTFTGSAIGGGQVSAENIAGRDINIGPEPQNRDEFNQQLQTLKSMLEQALANGEFTDAAEGDTAVSDLQDVLDETEKDAPRQKRIVRRLQDISETVQAAGKVGTAVLKATPVIAGLIKAAQVLF